jgi:hypothetical protein
VILAAEVTDECNDFGQLHPMIEATETSLAEAGIDQRPEKLAADAGYASEENFAALDAEDPDCYIATRNMNNNPTPRTGRRGPLRADATLVDKMDRKVSVNKGRAIYRRRQQIIEPVFGHQGTPRYPVVHATRQGSRRLRMEIDHCHPQPLEALPARPHHRVCRPIQPDRGGARSLTGDETSTHR